ncbi:MAG TPA: hypothetical protein PKE35_16125, partial [Anaerolineales bacterium]|nr:hypothetical protein [Anaerolineales bacterium]
QGQVRLFFWHMTIVLKNLSINMNRVNKADCIFANKNKQSIFHPMEGKEKNMKNGPCPECNSTEVYYSNVREGYGGLRSDYTVYIPTSRMALQIETYICLNCGRVRLFLNEKSKADIVGELPKAEGWTKIS